MKHATHIEESVRSAPPIEVAAALCAADRESVESACTEAAHLETGSNSCLLPTPTIWHAQRYTQLGWALCLIPPGGKAPRTPGWNTAAQAIRTETLAAERLSASPNNGLGLVHEFSGTCALDVDSLEEAASALRAIGLDLEELLAAGLRIVSREGRAKAIFRLPTGISLQSHKLVWPARPGESARPVLFELRAGPVQDVLPPTIHPNTQRPYTWAPGCEPWTVNAIPELPSALASLWMRWPEHQAALLGACPWALPATVCMQPARTISTTPRNEESVIAAFNAAHPIEAILQAHGYRKEKGDRYLAPSSSSGIPGVNILGDRAHSHHQSDPLNIGKPVDSFDVYCILEHGGDRRIAVRSAARTLGMERQPQSYPEVDLSSLELHPALPKAATERGRRIVVPPHLKTIPGALGVFVDHTLRSAQRPQPVISVASGLALGAVMMAQDFAGHTGARTNLYVVTLAESGEGKDHPRKLVKMLLDKSGAGDRLAGEDLTSGSAMLTRARTKPRGLWQLDEFGQFLQATTNPRAEPYKAEIVSNLLKLYSSADTIMRGTDYVDQEKSGLEIHYPCLSLNATASPMQFWDSLRGRQVLDGLVVLPPRSLGPALPGFD